MTKQMGNKEIDRLILKLIDNTLSDKESESLAIWLEAPENLNYFNEFIKINQLVNSQRKFDHRYSLKQFVEQSQNHNRFKRKMWYAAASIVVLISMGVYVTKKSFDSNAESSVIVNNITTGGDKAVLTASDGTVVLLEKGKVFQTKNISSNGEELVYKQNSDTNEDIAFNTLTIPRGGQFTVELSDGTKVWLNSESEIKYPTQFIDGEDRKVELVYGEAYFDVSPSSEHKGARFVLTNQDYKVEVVGTEFNVKSYNDEKYISTTLVEGKVNINYRGKVYGLILNEQSILNKESNEISKTEVDVYDIVSWKDGIFSFNRMPLKNIMTVLSRWYDMEVVFENNQLESKGFNGLLGKDQDILEILETLKQFGAINDYEIINKTVKLK